MSHLHLWFRLVVCGLLVGLNACSSARVDNAIYARGALVGMDKQTLLSCAGVPARRAQVDDAEYFTYTTARLDSSPARGSFGFSYGSRGDTALGLGFGLPVYGATVDTVMCDVTFTLRNGVVEQLVYGGSSGVFERLSQCYAIVENCLLLVPPLVPDRLSWSGSKDGQRPLHDPDCSHQSDGCQRRFS